MNKRVIILGVVILVAAIVIKLVWSGLRKIKVDNFKPAAVMFVIDSSASNQKELPEQKSLKDYNSLMKKLIKTENSLKSKNYFTKKSAHTYYKITFTRFYKNCKIQIGDLSDQLTDVNTRTEYYVDSKIDDPTKIEITTTVGGKTNKVFWNKTKNHLNEINDDSAKQKSSNLQK